MMGYTQHQQQLCFLGCRPGDAVYRLYCGYRFFLAVATANWLQPLTSSIVQTSTNGQSCQQQRPLVRHHFLQG